MTFLKIYLIMALLVLKFVILYNKKYPQKKANYELLFPNKYGDITVCMLDIQKGKVSGCKSGQFEEFDTIKQVVEYENTPEFFRSSSRHRENAQLVGGRNE